MATKRKVSTLVTLIILMAINCSSSSSSSSGKEVIKVNGGPDSVIWVVQLSDLHFSGHHPDRALEFMDFVGPTLSFINPSLVLITGDLTDGKSKDLLTMKQNEQEWIEYQNVIQDVVKKSGLNKSIFYDVRGNHDNFGVPHVGGASDFYSKYSINAQLGRPGNVDSVTLQAGERKHLFVGIDTTMAVGIRGPTNLFGHPTDELLAELDSELSQYDSESTKPVTKVSFGHFPLSFSAASESGKTLKDVFLKHSVSAYLCGHLHTRFGKNLKRHHQPGNNFIQQNIYQTRIKGFSNGSSKNQEFWEWEMGDWRKSRSMRIVAIDRGHTSFIDINFKLGANKTFILPTFPLDSRLMWRSSLKTEYEHQIMDPSDYLTIRALVFSRSPIMSVVARVYDSQNGVFTPVLDASMSKIESENSRGALYAVPWNFKAFEDPNPERYWLQIESIDINGFSTITDLRPFSINGIPSFLSWNWKEFMMMGCQWDALYFPLLWLSFGCLLFVLLTPVAITTIPDKRYTIQNFTTNKSFINGVGWVLTELYKLRLVWCGFVGYLFYLVLFPLLYGRLFTENEEMGYMTYKGWVVSNSLNPDSSKKLEYIAFPDIMVIIIPHLVFVVFPSLLLVIGLAVERDMYRIHLLALSGKKEDDEQNDKICNSYISKRWMQKFLMLIFLGIVYRHFKNCRALAKAYEMNSFLHFPVYSFSIPILLVYAIYKIHTV